MRQKRMRRKKDRLKKKYSLLVAMLAVLGMQTTLASKAEAKPAWADDNFLQYVNYSSKFSEYDGYDESNLQANKSYKPKFPNDLQLRAKIADDEDDDGFALGGVIGPSDLPAEMVDSAKMGQLEYRIDTVARIDNNDTMIVVANGEKYARSKNSEDGGLAVPYPITSGWNAFKPGENVLQFVLDDVRTPLSYFESIKLSLVDSVGPGLQYIALPNAGDGKFHLGESIDIVLHFDEAVTIDTSFELPMNTGKKAIYYAGNGSKEITFRYTVVADDMTRTDVGKMPYNQGKYLGIGVRTKNEWELPQGGDDKIGGTLPSNVKDPSDNQMLGSTDANPYNWKSKYDTAYNYTGGSSYYNQLDSSKLQVDGIVPIINDAEVTTSTGTKYLKAGDKLTIKLTLDDVVVGTAGYIAFNNGKEAVYKSGSGSKVVTYEYVVQPEDEGNNLAYKDFVKNLGITDDFGNTPIVQNGYNPPLSLAGEAICVDAKLPTVEFIPDTAGTYERQHTVKLNVIEKGSGLEGDVLKYAWVQSPEEKTVTWVTYGIMDGKIPSVSKDKVNGNWYVTVLMSDKAGNINRVTSPVIRFDNIIPGISLRRDGSDKYEGTLTPQVNVTDAHAGPDDTRLEYQWLYHDDEISESSWLPFLNGQPVQTPKFPEHGRYTLQVRSFDRAGNKAEMTSQPYYLDTKPPEITITPDGNMTQQKTQKAQLHILDANSTLKPISYYWSQDADTKEPKWKDLGGQIEVSTDVESQPMEGVWFLHVRAADIWNNESIQSRAFYVDNTPPKVAFEYAPSLTESVKEAKVSVKATDVNTISALSYQWTNTGTKPSSSDAGWASLNNGDTLTKDKADGDWYVHIKAIDSFGNESITTSRVFKLSNAAPKISDFQIELPSHTNVSEVKVHISTASKEPYTYHIEDHNHNEIRSGAVAGGAADFTLDVPTVEGTYDYFFSFENEVHNHSEKLTKSIVYDRTLSVADAVYSETAATRHPVTVSLVNLSDNATPVNEIKTPNGSSHVFAENGSYTFTVVDLAGNERQIPVHVGNIDTVLPNIRIVPVWGLQPSQTVSATVYGTDNMTALTDISVSYQWTNTQRTPEASDSSWKSAVNESVISGTDLANGEWYLHVKAVDQAGNTAIQTSERLLVDRVAPSASVTYSMLEPTANTITAHLVFDEPGIRVLNTPQGIPYHEFTENGSFTFRYEDEAGNQGATEAVVNHINPMLPRAKIVFSTNEVTKDDVTVTVATYDNRYILTDFVFDADMGEHLVSSKLDGQSVTESVYKISHNGNIAFVIKDTLGANADQPVKVPVWNIDKKAPVAILRYSLSNMTRNSVSASLVLEDESPTVILNNGGNNTVLFKENDSFTFEFQDIAGNRSTMTAQVTNIDNEIPTATVTYNTTEMTNKPVTATILPVDNSGAPVTIMNNGGQASYAFTENGKFTFIVRDRVGNESTIPVEVANIEKSKPTGSVAYSVKALTNQDVIATLTAVDDSGEPVAITSEGGPTHTFKSNGVFTFTFKDKAGNEGTVVAGVNWIDKTPPRGYIVASESKPTQNDVTLTLNLPDGGNILNNDGKPTIVAHENGDYTFKVADSLGNSVDMTYQVSNIDRKAPIGQIVYTTDRPTNKDVIATVMAGESFKVLNNSGSKQVVFKENGEFIFNLEDEAGNRSSVKATVNQIDRTAPTVTVKYNMTQLTNQNVTAAVYGEEGEKLIAINNDEKTSMVFKQNGSFTFIVEDEAGNRVRVGAKVQNIDKTAPLIKFVNPFMVFQPGERIDLKDYEAYDDHDGALAADAVKFTPTELDASKGGNYEVTYSATDQAGNVAEAKRPIKVLSPKDFLVLVNGRFEPSAQYMVEGSQVTFKVVNFVEQYKAAYKTGGGILKSGDFKLSSEVLENGAHGEPVAKEIVYQAKQSGWHTFYFQDLNRRTVVINIFFLGSE
ncbi:DUF5011 domain-containing protein [Paenibacillus sp. SYP-B3998]|uniref:DUF5011 domain-containing protein n=1 Tax=Paenibacillus sp. SYP-B3998 TaxID=2678564 RepID=A0A6G3ZR79_9BACL|nr:Ig-like domain repeat protein [Paenibacillus sp. SYP-B3998]NEW04713.1 DUF5011 domain-containing protein [Paenibacillus sp. SYP-B3998]